MEFVIGFVVLVLDIIAIISIVGAPKSVAWKLIWTLVVLLLPVIGMIVYFLVGKST